MSQVSEPHEVLVAVLLLQRALERRADLFFAEYDLTDAQFNILNLLAANEGWMEQMELAERLLVGKSSLSIVLNRMTKAGLIERKEHPRDRRQSLLTLSSRGRKLWSKISPVYKERVREIFGSLPKSRREAFIDDLETLYAGLQGQPDRAGSLREIVRKLTAKD